MPFVAPLAIRGDVAGRSSRANGDTNKSRGPRTPRGPGLGPRNVETDN
jgi:hypothetical protein